jgi:hypothetical protein
VLLSKIEQDSGNAVILFFHFLVVTAALLCLPGPHKGCHCLENLVHPAHMFVQEMIVVNLQEPMITLILI